MEYLVAKSVGSYLGGRGVGLLLKDIMEANSMIRFLFQKEHSGLNAEVVGTGARQKSG